MALRLGVVLGVTLAISPSASAAPDSLRDPAHEPQPIIGGDATAPGEFDGVVAIVAGQGLCTGTVVSARLILTAGHCLSSITPEQEVRVYYGDSVEPEQSTAAVSWGVHPEFCPDCENDIHDFGYVLLGADFDVPGGFLRPIIDQREWDDSMVVHASVTLVGYGKDPESEDGGIGIKRKVTTDISKFSPLGLEFFAGGDNRDSCEGDSGGPAFVQVDGGMWRLAGITSRGSNPCGGGGFYGVPYASLCWVRGETGIDLLEGSCDACDCLDTAPSEDGQCRVAPHPTRGIDLGLSGLVMLVLVRGGFRRRRRSR